MRIIVTRPDNVIEEENGEIKLIDEDDIGYLVNTHIVQTAVPDGNGQPQIGFSVLLQVHWELKRTPAVALVSPHDLYWVNFLSDNEEETNDDEEIDDENHQEFATDTNALI